MNQKNILIVTLLLTIGANSFGQSSEKNDQYTYTRHVVRTFTWGTDDDQLGFRDSKTDYSDKCGPTSIVVSQNNDIYIQDYANNRIVKYSNIGEYIRTYYYCNMGPIAVDSKDNLYVELRGNYIQGVDKEGISIGGFSYSLPASAYSKMAVDETKNKVAMWDPMIGGSKCIIDKPDLNGPFCTSKQKGFAVSRDITSKEFKNIVHTRDSNYYYLNGTIIIMPFYREKQLKIVTAKDRIRHLCFLKENKQGDMLMQVDVTNNAKYLKKAILLDSKSKESTLIDIDQDERIYFSQDYGDYLLDMDENSNVYHLWIQSDGATLIKWTRTEITNE